MRSLRMARGVSRVVVAGNELRVFVEWPGLRGAMLAGYCGGGGAGVGGGVYICR